MVAKELAEAGRDVILLEEGPPFGKRDFKPEAGEAMQRMLREGGSRVAQGNLFSPTMQAIALGGGSVVNTASFVAIVGAALARACGPGADVRGADDD